MKILVVDDSEIMRKILVKELLELNFTDEDIVQACDGIEAVNAILGHHGSRSYSLILMDWNMPNMLGIEAVKRIRDAGVQAPIVMVTTEAEKANVVAAIKAGANNYLIKPFTRDDFQKKLTQILGEISIFQQAMWAETKKEQQAAKPHHTVFESRFPDSQEQASDYAPRIDYSNCQIIE